MNRRLRSVARSHPVTSGFNLPMASSTTPSSSTSLAALVGLLRPHLAKEDEARALIRELFVSSADIEPDETKIR